MSLTSDTPSSSSASTTPKPSPTMTFTAPTEDPPKTDPKTGEKIETAPNGMKKIIIGVCAMQRKANSKPMKAIMQKILEYYQDWLSFIIFPEDLIINEPVEKWPLCDCLISFHATDFPLYKAIEYERLRRPYVINDLHRQYDLLDRRKVFRALARAGIAHPRHCVLIRDAEGNVEGGEVRELNDSIEVNGMVFNKPFVEKPISAEDHNVYIYYPSSVGGGSQRLFRKINDRSSWYSPVSHIRREGSYIYEEFIPADGTDVKVYAVGPFYAHAEARKAPGLDGKVDRDSEGKEVRYPVILSAKEKMIARRVVCAFGQTVCGFDLLRANGMSYVCDVNGFSFVKTSTKYYEDTAKILGNTVLRRLASCLSIPWHIPYQDDDPPLVSTPSGKIMELRCVIAVIRHGDRTPKQKMKITVNDERFFNLFDKYDGKIKKEIKMKRPNQLMEVLELSRDMLHEGQDKRNEYMKELAELDPGSDESKNIERKLDKVEEQIKKWDQMRTVLEMYGHFSGINRKVQLKYLKPKTESDDEMRKKPALMLIIKWGGELTTAGVLQAEALGKLFRTLYPGIRRTDGKACPEDTQGLGFLRLHSTYRHDLKIYSSDEGRVQMTAAAFARGLLALEGELTPILMQMVKSSNTDPLLNDDFNARQFQTDLKGYLHSALQVDRDFTTEDYAALNPSSLRSINNAMDFIKNPRKMCHEIAAHVQKMVEIIRWHKMNAATSEKQLYLNESWELAESRWSKELREFRRTKKDEEGNTMIDFDISKIPDIYDNIKYDLEHNPELGINNECEFERMYVCVKNMADIVVPQEYGISEESKISIAQRVCTPLLAKLRNDLHRCVQDPEESDETTRLDPRASEGIATPMRHVRTRLYFTSESHIHTLMNLIRYGGLCSPDDQKWQRAMKFLSSVTEFNYMTQVVLMVYEDSRSEAGKEGTDRFHIELLFSPGLYPCFQTEKERIYETRFNTSKNQKASSKKQPKHSSSSGKNSDTSDKETTSEEPSRKESMTGAAKAALESFISHRSISTDSSMVAAAKTKVSLSPRIQNTPPNWLQAPSNANPSNANSGTTTLTKIESGNTLIIEEDKSDAVSTGGDRHVTTVDVEGGEVRELNDSIEVNGMVFNKPFVEKPISAEDHNVYIYYPSSVGGGSQRLFRKINDRSSWYSPVSHIRREGSYIYEEFIPADGTDVKVYAVGPFYAHAEARKAPGLDGKVDRDSEGKEVRYPVILSAKEKMIARRVVCAFGQTVCGFDLLRANGMSYVCDVNGFSFVKTSTKYYEDTAKILGNTVLRRLASCLSIPWHIPYQDDDPPLVSTPSGKIMELRCVIAVIRHGDRTPKQKMKITVNDERFFNLFDKYDGKIKKEIKMKRPNQLMEVLELSRDMLHEGQDKRNEYMKELAELDPGSDESKNIERKLDKVEEQIKKWDQMRTVLEMYGHFSGINRKVQLKYLKPKTESDDEMRKKPALMLIIKWGGELTTAGVLQAEALGKLFRTLYPGIRRTDGKACPEDTQGLGFLRLHSTYRHDLKIYSSDEGRVQMTAAAFARGLLALEGELTPILMQMVKSSNTDPLLNDDFNARQFQTDLKGYLHSALQVDRDFTTEDYAALNPSSLRSINNAMDFIKNPRKMCHEIAAHVQKMVEIIRWHKMNAATSEKQLYLNESWELAESRWSKELREFRRTKKDEEGNTMIDFDISKIPDIYDNIKYDLEHNPELGINNECEFERMYVCVKNMADIVVPQEYGISEESKISIAQRVCTPLLAKLRNDLHRCVQDPEESDETTRLDPRASEGIATPMRHVRTRLYFTSESHIHTLMNLIRYGGLCSPDDQKWQRAMKFLSSVTEFNYMTQVVLMVYEDSRSEAGKEGTDRFHIELLFSPGLYPCFQTEKERIYETRFNTSKNQKASSKKQPKHSSSSGKNSDTSDKETTSEEPSRKESMTGAAKAALESFISHRSISTDSSMVAAAKTKVSLSPRIQNTPPNWLQAPSNANPSNANSGTTTLTKIESGNTLIIEEDKSDAVSTGGDRHVTTVDGRAITESDDELADHSVNLVVLGEVGGGKEYDTLNPSKLVAKKLLEGDSKDSKKIQFILNQKSLPGGVLKSMSDISCNRRPRSASVEESEERNEERPQSRQSAKKLQHQQLLTPDELDDNQATVGSGRGKWAKELVAETYGAMGKSPPPEIQEPKEDRRPYASEVFSRGDVIVMKRSESNEYHSLAALAPSVASTATISSGSRDDEQAASSSRRSRFPYKFKHHTVNLLTGKGGVENRLISTDVLMGKFNDSTRKNKHNSAVLSTAVIARSSSAPRLQTFTADDQISVNEIRRFWPPLRSLETCHDNISYKQLDGFFEQILNSSTPLPSPPKTPVHNNTAEYQQSLDVRMKNTIARLKAMDA